MKPIVENYHSLIKKIKELEDDITPDKIHDKRVILRRIFPILSAYGIKPSKLKNGEKAFKLYGKLRDIQVQIEKLKIAEFIPYLNEYLYFLKDKELELQEKVKKFSKKKKIKFPHLDKKQKVDYPKIKEKANLQLNKLVERIQMEAVDDVAEIHALRIEFKKFRYLVEVLALIENIDETKIGKLKEYQDLLGEIHDYEVLISGIKKFSTKSKPEEEIDVDWLEDLQNSLIQTFDNETEQIVEVCRDVLLIDSTYKTE
ncbi:MAG: CHAD domain-containing protein [Paludibacter sp.]